MLHYCLRRLTHHPLIHHQIFRFSFNSAERAYLMHWALGLETLAALTLGVVITVFLMVFTVEDM